MFVFKHEVDTLKENGVSIDDYDVWTLKEDPFERVLVEKGRDNNKAIYLNDEGAYIIKVSSDELSDKYFRGDE